MGARSLSRTAKLDRRLSVDISRLSMDIKRSSIDTSHLSVDISPLSVDIRPLSVDISPLSVEVRLFLSVRPPHWQHRNRISAPGI